MGGLPEEEREGAEKQQKVGGQRWGQRPVPGAKGGGRQNEKKKETEVGDGQDPPFQRELVAAAEDLSGP